jgi:hypothetical protein
LRPADLPVQQLDVWRLTVKSGARVLADDVVD